MNKPLVVSSGQITAYDKHADMIAASIAFMFVCAGVAMVVKAAKSNA